MSAHKRALVTGASEGIGRAFAARLANAGYRVTAVARNEQRLRELTTALGEGHRHLVADLATASGVEAVQADVEGEHYDLLVNNAGFGRYGAFIDNEWPDMQGMLRVNIEALVALSHTYLSQARAGDALINISSLVGFLPLPQMSVYAATKAFVSSFSESLWAEQRPRGIFVMGFCPGPTITEFHSRAEGTGRQAPNFMMQTADEVVDEAMQALRRRSQPTVISGVVNRVSVGTLKHLPRKQLVSILNSTTRPS